MWWNVFNDQFAHPQWFNKNVILLSCFLLTRAELTSVTSPGGSTRYITLQNLNDASLLVIGARQTCYVHSIDFNLFLKCFDDLFVESARTCLFKKIEKIHLQLEWLMFNCLWSTGICWLSLSQEGKVRCCSWPGTPGYLQSVPDIC